MHLFYAVYYIDYEELYRLADHYRNNKKFVRNFFSTYYKDKHYPLEFDIIIHRKEIRSLVLKDYMKDYEEWSKDVSFCDLNSFKSYVKDMSDMLFEEFGEEELLGNYFNWFSKRLSSNRKM